MCVHDVFYVCWVVVVKVQFLFVLLNGFHIIALMLPNWLPGFVDIYAGAEHEDTFKAAAIDVQN